MKESKLKKIITIFITAILFLSCEQKQEPETKSELETKMNNIAEDYVKLVLKIGQYDPDFVDAYYGPKEWKPAGRNLKLDSTAFNELNSECEKLFNELESLGEYKATELETLRYRLLYKQLLACKTKINMINGTILPFNQESKALYDAVAPSHNTDYFKDVFDELDKLLPGKGSLDERFSNFRKKFEIPKEKLSAVFDAAIKECRKRTMQHIKLPQNENFSVEYVKNQPWGAYNWYKGNSFSLIQVNTDLPTYIDGPVGLAAHEGYPGHHVLNALLESNLVKKHDWIEFCVYPLFSPLSLLAEGTANYGVDLVFPCDEKIKFEKEVLFPLSGLSTQDADLYYKVLEVRKKLNYAANEAARNYLDGKWNREQTIEWLQKYDLHTKEGAERMLSFIERYRSYVINYNLGEDMVKEYIEKNGGTDDDPERKWELFEKLISTPQTPSGLTK